MVFYAIEQPIKLNEKLKKTGQGAIFFLHCRQADIFQGPNGCQAVA
jgi:hypothetical protein